MKLRLHSLKILLLSALLAFACNKKKNTVPESANPVPSIPITINVYPNDPLNFNIQHVGGWKYIDGGVNGIIVYRKSEEEFVALDRTSSYYPGNSAARVQVMKDNFLLQDTISDSRWRIVDGGVSSGPATWSLRLYGTSYDGNTLRITN